jgi:hypothetical protein
MLDLTTIDLMKPEDRELIVVFLSKLVDKISHHDLALLPQIGPMSGTVYGRAGSEWPRIGANLGPTPNGIFTSESYKQLFIHGEVVKVYGAGCPGLRTLASTTDLPLRKIGATLASDIRTRLKDAGRDHYAALVKVGEGYQLEPGFDTYLATPFVCAKSPSPNSPVSIEPRSMSVILPKNMTFREFEGALQKALLPTSLNHWAATADGIEHFKKLNINSAVAIRYNQYGYGGNCPPTPAEEIYITRPRSDGDRLVAVLEHIVLKYLGLIK